MLVFKDKSDRVPLAMDGMSREELKQRIRDFHGHIKLDFTDAYLDTASIEHLRHILFAAIDNERCRPIEDL